MAPLRAVQKNYLKRIYYDPTHAASYQGARALHKFVKKDNQFKVSLNQIKKWMKNDETYTLNKNVLRTFERPRVIVKGIDDQWEADLAFMVDYANDNDNYKFLLMVIDVFSRYAWVQPLPDKRSADVIAGFNAIFQSTNQKPRRLRTDRGAEFTAKTFEDYLSRKKISHFTTSNEKQANYAERFVQTIKRRIYRHMIATNSSRYIDDLQNLVTGYNRSFHSGIQSEPINVTPENESRLWWQMYWPKSEDKNLLTKTVTFKFRPDDTVRIAGPVSRFQRQYDIHWSHEIFKIDRGFIRQGIPMYKLRDFQGEIIQGTFNENELQHVTPPAVYKIDKVLKYKGQGRNHEALVSWLGWPRKFNSWIKAADIENI